MQVVVFRCDVRARDQNLQLLNNRVRENLDPVQRTEVADLLLRHCTIVDSWSAVPENAVRIVPTRAAEQEVMNQYLANKVTSDYAAVDEIQNNTTWMPAAEYISRKLDRAVYEYSLCRLFVDAIVRMTYNERHGSVHFSQGQLAVVTGLPDTSRPFAEQRLRLRLAPPGVRLIDPANIPQQWPELLIGRRTTESHVVGRGLQLARRNQFAVRYHLTSTIHRIQGDTVALYATQISEADRHYRLWQKEQLTVLVSRAQQCADMIFVGPIAQTRDAIINILARTSKWDVLVDNCIESLDVLSHPAVREVRMQLSPYMPLYCELPTTSCGYVYEIVSIANSRICYVGETDDLKKCLREHNTGYGVEQTRPTILHPWGVYAFVCRFECDDPELGVRRRKSFLAALRLDLSLGPDAVYSSLLAEVQRCRAENLVIVKCGEVRPSEIVA